MTTASRIMSFLFRNNLMNLLYWRADDFKSMRNDKRVSFTVKGSAYRGKVKIEYDNASNLFIVTVGKKIRDNIRPDKLKDVMIGIIGTGDPSHIEYVRRIMNDVKKGVF